MLTIEGLDATRVTEILDTAESFANVTAREVKKVPLLRGKTVVNLFVEPSTRTRISFELAEKRLSADSINFSTSTSSVVKGENLMEGYYKNEEATKAAIDEEGWLHTGDLGITDEDGFIYIKGRSKSMLLGPSGQNIYPEEIESKLCNLPYVGEAVVLMNKSHKLEALVYPDYDQAKAEKVEAELEEKMEENRKEYNQHAAAYETLQKIHIHEKEFEKTPKRSIKRFLYKLEE